MNSISVITVVRNGAKSLESTLQSVIAQDCPLEYILVDGLSTDGTQAIIKNYEQQIAKWESRADSGIYEAMNSGVRMATGEWLCFMNCGDRFVDANVVGRVLSALHRHRHPDVLYGNILVEKHGGWVERIAGEPQNSHRMYFCHQSAFVKRRWLEAFPFDESHPLSADLKFFKQCRQAGGRFVHINLPVARYDRSGLSHTQRSKGLRDNVRVVCEMDRGVEKWKFLFRLWFVIVWLKITLHS